MHNSPTMKQMMHTIINPEIFTSVNVLPLSISSIREPMMIGMLIKKEYFALILSQPIILAVAIVVPDLLMPGMTAIP